MSGIKYKIYSLGCKVNQYDGEKLAGLLKSAGFILGEKNVDLAVINTCAVTKIAVRKSRQMVSRAKKKNPKAKIVLSGCWPKVYGKDFKKQNKADLILPGNDYKISKIKKLFQNSIPSRRDKIKNLPNLPAGRNNNFPAGDWSRSRYFLKIQDGCEQFCAYCIIPYARGKLESRLMADIIKEAEAAVKSGREEIVLCGIHLGLFGINNREKTKEEKGADLAGLLKELVKIRGLVRIRLSSIEITEVTDKLINFMAKSKKMCRHLHLPLQSGSDKILKLMNRPYSSGYFLKRVKKIRAVMPDIALTTDVIVGFPGENEKDFNDTLNFVKKINFSRLHVFSFSAHEKTPAFTLPGRVGEKEIKKRSKKLRELGKNLEKEYREKFFGQTLKVAVEAARGNEYKGKSEHYFDVWFSKKDMVAGRGHGDFWGKIIKIKFLKN